VSANIFDLMASMESRCVEPNKRMVAGRYGYAIHRFPIRGGIRFVDAMTESIRPTKTPFMAMLLRKGRG
jgi:hypothetical protein